MDMKKKCSCDIVSAFSEGERAKAELDKAKAMLDSWVQGDIKHLESDAEFVGCGIFNYTSITFPIESVRFEKATEIKDGAFYGCKMLKSVSFPNVGSIASGAFNGCTSLSAVEFPNATQLNSGAFANCTGLKSAVLKSCTEIVNMVFFGCTALERLDFWKLEKLQDGVFSGLVSLATLILRSETMCVLTDNTFNDTAIASNTGYIYVPKAIIGEYRTTYSGKSFADYFRALEDYTVDGTVTGELDESKI